MTDLSDCDLPEVRAWWKAHDDFPITLLTPRLVHAFDLANAAVLALRKYGQHWFDMYLAEAEKVKRAEAERGEWKVLWADAQDRAADQWQRTQQLEAELAEMKGFFDAAYKDSEYFQGELSRAEDQRDRERAAWIESAAESEGWRQKFMEAEAERDRARKRLLIVDPPHLWEPTATKIAESRTRRHPGQSESAGFDQRGVQKSRRLAASVKESAQAPCRLGGIPDAKDRCPECRMDLCGDEEGNPHCPHCDWRPT
jgi:hypothetical protein